MDENFFYNATYRFKAKPYHFSIPLIIGLFGWALLLHVPGWTGIAFFWLSVFVAVCCTIWITAAGITVALIDLHYERTGEVYTGPQSADPILEDFTAPNIQIDANRDQRWDQWASRILSGEPLKRSNWTGAGRPFSREEYDQFMDVLKSRKVIDYANGKTSDNGYVINGGGGRAYLRSMSEGRINLPLPSSN